MKVYVIIIFYDIDSVMVFGWGFYVYGILWIWFDVNIIIIGFFYCKKFLFKIRLFKNYFDGWIFIRLLYYIVF